MATVDNFYMTDESADPLVNVTRYLRGDDVELRHELEIKNKEELSDEIVYDVVVESKRGNVYERTLRIEK